MPSAAVMARLKESEKGLEQAMKRLDSIREQRQKELVKASESPSVRDSASAGYSMPAILFP